MSFKPTTSLGAMSAHIANLTLEKQGLETEQKMNQSENILLVFKLSGEMFSLVNERQMEKKFLGSSNTILRIENDQLVRQNTAELDTGPTLKSIGEMVIAKIKDIELTFLRCKKQYPEHYHSDRVIEFAILREKVTQLATLKNDVPKQIENKDQDISVQEQAISPFVDSHKLITINPLLKVEIETLAKKHEQLEIDVSPLRLENLQLIKKHQKIVESHKDNLNIKDLKTLIKKILDEVKTTNDKIVWEQLTKVSPELVAGHLRNHSPCTVELFYEPYDRFLSDIVALEKDQMQSLINTLEITLKEDKT